MATKRKRLIERAKSRVRAKAGGRLKPGDFSPVATAKSGVDPTAKPEAPEAPQSMVADQASPPPAVDTSTPPVAPATEVKKPSRAAKRRSPRAKKKPPRIKPLPPFEVPPPVEAPPVAETPPPVEAPPVAETPPPAETPPSDTPAAGSTWTFLEKELSAKPPAPPPAPEGPGPARPTLPPSAFEAPTSPPPLKVVDPPAFRSPLSPRTSAFEGPDDAEFAARIDSVAELAKLVDEPTYILAATPNRMSRTSGALDLNSPKVTKLVTEPPQLRNFGFDLDAGGAAQIADGWLRRAEGERYKALGLWDDGTLIFVATAGEEFLCWGRQLTEYGLLLNEAALVESTYLFAELARRLHVGLQLAMPEIEFRLVLRELMPEALPISMSTTRDSDFADGVEEDIHAAPAAGARFDARHRKDVGPGAVAYSLVAQVYAWFGIEESRIPFSERGSGGAGLISANRQPDQVVGPRSRWRRRAGSR
ncbi:MAG: hypothetical protein QF634_06265 [Vicinamibacterales bacterium]|nr:hypothetical protein [Vicinamibacterales bacterium]